MYLNGFFQNAYVTRDLEQAVAFAREHHGVDDFIFFEPQMDVYTAQGGHGFAHIKVALAWAGSLMLEFVQPVAGNVQHYVDMLPPDPADNSLRLHHLGIRVTDWDKARAEIEKNRWPIAHEGGIEGVKFAYLDARPTLGHYLEYIWFSPLMWEQLGGRD